MVEKSGRFAGNSEKQETRDEGDRRHKEQFNNFSCEL
jgi:hypothetical protein